MKAWGHKFTPVVYVADGVDVEDVSRRLVEALNEAVPEAQFIGLRYDVVVADPRDQGGT